MKLTHEDIAMRLAALVDLAIEEVATGPITAPRVERLTAMLHAARDGIERLATDLPKRTPAVAAELLGGNVVAFPAGRRANG